MFRNAGRRNRYAAIKQRSGARDAAGQPSTTWSTLRSEWVGVYPPKVRAMAEQPVADRTAAPSPFMVELPYCTDVTIDMQLEVEGETFTIVDVVPDIARQSHTMLMCLRGVL